MYPADGIAGLPARASSSRTCCSEHETEVRRCLQKGAHKVQIDFTEGRLAVKVDPDGRPARQLHRPQQPRARALLRRGARSGSACTPAPAATATRRTAPTSTTPSCCPSLFELQRRQLLRRAGRRDATASACSRSSASTCKPRPAGLRRRHRRRSTRASRRPRRSATGCSRPREYIPVDQLGTTDDCGFSPFSDDTSTTRDTAFAKIRARVDGTALAVEGARSRYA